MTDEATSRAAVVAEARAWIGARWHHEAMVRPASGEGGAVDCAMLLVAAYGAAGLIPQGYDPRPYPRDWMLHQKEERLLQHVLNCGAVEIGPDEAKPGDIVLWKVGHTLSHVGIMSGWPHVIHAYAHARQVQEDDLTMRGPLFDPAFPRRFLSFWGAA